MRGEFGVRTARGDWVEFRVSEDRALSLFENHKDAHELVGNITAKLDPAEWEVLFTREAAKAA